MEILKHDSHEKVLRNNCLSQWEPYHDVPIHRHHKTYDISHTVI